MKVRNKYLMVMAVVWGVCFLLSAASYAVILHPHLDYRKALEAKVALRREEYARAVQAARARDQNHLVEQVQNLRTHVTDFVVDSQAVPALDLEISKLANEAKLESLGMRPLNKTGSETQPSFERIGEKRVDLTFSAGFRRFAAFLNTLERHHPVIFVESFSISRAAEKDAEPQANMGLAVLVEKDPQRDEARLGTQ